MACRSDDYGKVVEASESLDQATAYLQVLLARGMVAMAENDGASAALANVDQATNAVDQAAADLSLATQRYVDGTALAASDPDRFLSECGVS
jgi:flagellin-like hook-associated protein FlgL